MLNVLIQRDSNINETWCLSSISSFFFLSIRDIIVTLQHNEALTDINKVLWEYVFPLINLRKAKKKFCIIQKHSNTSMDISNDTIQCYDCCCMLNAFIIGRWASCKKVVCLVFQQGSSHVVLLIYICKSINHSPKNP